MAMDQNGLRAVKEIEFDSEDELRGFEKALRAVGMRMWGSGPEESHGPFEMPPSPFGGPVGGKGKC